MAIKQVSERIINNSYINLDDLNKEPIYHHESTLFMNNNIIYKIYNKMFRYEKSKYMYLLTKLRFNNAANIIDELYQGDKFIGITMNYLNSFITLSNYMNNLDLYEIKKIMNILIHFYKNTLDNNFLYWDNHLNNMGLSNNEFYILDIDSMIYNPSNKEIQYAYNNLLTLFYELVFKKHLRNDYDDYKSLIFNICENAKYLEYKLSLNDIENIINNTTETLIDEKKSLLKKFR